jgi:hypothetical protein
MIEYMGKNKGNERTSSSENKGKQNICTTPKVTRTAINDVINDED